MAAAKLDETYVYEALLQFNYFPMVRDKRDDISPFFNTQKLSVDIANNLCAHDVTGRQKNRGFDQIEYRGTRFNGAARLMHIPHPYPYTQLCECIRDNWDKLDYVHQNTRSQIKPIRHDDSRILVMKRYDEAEEIVSGRLVVMEKEQFPEDTERFLKLCSGASFKVEADVSSCFPSIYSHAIPWALVGHQAAKKDRERTTWFNQLDEKQRQLKRNETQGVPIGPATSHIVSEIILGRVDEELDKLEYDFERYIDDYKCYCETQEQADAFIRDLERELSKYLLTLNARKIRVDRLPLPTKSSWITEISPRIPAKGRLSAKDAIKWLDFAVDLQRRYPDGSVLKYATRVIERKKKDEECRRIVAKYLLQLAYHAPAVLPSLCNIDDIKDCGLDRDMLDKVLERQITYRRSDTLCWMLYLYEILGEALDDEQADKIVQTDDCLAMASLIVKDEHINVVVDYVKALDHTEPYGLDRYWLLIHELILRSNLRKAQLKQYAEDTGLKLLIDNDVSFLAEIEEE